MLEERLRGAGAVHAFGEGLVRVIDLVGVPNLGALVESGSFTFERLLELRESKEGATFRQWLKNLDPTDPRDVERAVVEDLLAVSRIQSPGARIMRLVVTVGLGLINPATGVIASAADGLVVDKLFRGWRPRVFVERLRKLLDNHTAT